MQLGSKLWSAKSVYLLLPLMALAFYMAFIPHQGYPYLLHIDEWVHLANSEALLRAGSTSYIDPFFGSSVESLTSNLEIGFHLFWGIFHQISGIPWLTIYRFFPSIILAMTVLSVFLLAQRQGFGWEAALFTALIPTTVGILGPAFLVPVTMGLLFVSLSIFIAFNFRGFWSYLTLFLFLCFLLVIHAPSAICLVIILTPYILLNLRSDFKHSLGIILALAIPFLAPFPWIFGRLLTTAGGLLSPQALPDYVDFPRIIKSYGYLPIGLCLLGTLVLAIKGGRKNYGLVLGLLLLLMMLVTFFTFHYGIPIVYERGLTFMMLMVAIIAGAGLISIRTSRLPERLNINIRVCSIIRYLGWTLCLVLIGLTLYIGIPARQGIPYYHMINDEEYKTFVWIKDNVSDEYDKAILDPWKATPFTAITGKMVYSRIHAFPTEKDIEARTFLEEGCSDTDFLRQNGISIIFTEGDCWNPDLTKVRENVYLFKK